MIFFQNTIGIIFVGASLATVLSASQNSVPIASYGQWVLMEEIDSAERISFRAILHDQIDPTRYLQWRCWPSVPNAGLSLWLVDAAVKNSQPRNFLITFNNFYTQSLDQREVKGSQGHLDLFPLTIELVGCGMCNPTIPPHEGALFLGVEGQKMRFIPDGADDVFENLVERCHF